jgi:PAS domain S-box-containing protein
MTKTIQSLLVAPVFADEEKTRVGRFVHIISLGLMLGGVIPILHNAWAGQWPSVAALAVAEGCVLAVLWLNRTGRQGSAIHLLVLGLLATATGLLCISQEGFRDVAILVYPSTLMVAALLLNRRSFISTTVTAIACVSGVVLAEISGWLVTPFSAHATWRNLADVVILLSLTAVVSGLLSKSLRESLARARRDEAALRESEQRLQQLAGATFEGIGITEQGLIIEGNDQLARMLGWDVTELVGRPVQDFVAPQSRESVLEHIGAGGSEPYEHTALRRDGSTFPVEARGRVMTYRGRQVRVTAIRDITERKQAEAALRKNEAMLSSILNSVPQSIFWKDRAGVYLGCNEVFARAVGLGAPALVAGRTDFDFPWTGAEAEAYRADDREVMEAKRPKTHIIEPLQQADGKRLWVDTSKVPLLGADGQVYGVLGVFEDITERKQAEKRLQQSRERLRALSSRLQSLREEERTRIAREIHDHLGQMLTALKLDLRSLERRISGMAETDLRTALAGKVTSATALADETIQSVQKIASELRPGILDRLGLAAAIEAEAQAFQDRTGVHCEWVLPQDPVAIPASQATAAFRIFQEVLTNVARHAQATRVAVRLVCEADNLLLEVSDNGIGIQKGDLENPKSLGLLGMQERAAMLGGQTTFGQPGGTGTTVTVRLPLREKAGPNP